jgi:pentatricopeptide repeat protein
MKRIDQAEHLVNSLKTPNTIIYTILMKAYVKAKDIEKAQALMTKMEASTSH